MKWIFFLLCCFISFICCAQDTIIKYLNNDFAIVANKQDANFYAKVSKTTNGYNAIIFYRNDTKALEGSFYDKKLTYRNGDFTFYYAGTGRIFTNGHYDYNVPNGVWQHWYENGRKIDSGKMYYEKLVGRWKYWYPNGVVESNCKYADSFMTPKGVASGLPKEEKPKAIAMYLHNFFGDVVKVGNWTTYYENAQIKDSVYYVEGNEDGFAKQWHKNGNIESVGYYTLGKKQGIWEWYHQNGKLATKETYNENKIKALQCYDTTGKFESDFCGLIKPAMFPGGPTQFEKYIAKEMQYPEAAKPFGHSAVVHCVFVIDTKGKVKSIQFGDSPIIYFNKTIEDALYKMPLWEPAISHNRLADFEVKLAVPFILTKQ
jgi:antitoxin component YwqK of YwqJK toxin-antitoxin module